MGVTTMKRQMRLFFPQPLIDKPILWQLGQKFQVITNIHKASIDGECGWIELDIEGEEGETESAIQWLRQTGVEVNPIDQKTN